MKILFRQKVLCEIKDHSNFENFLLEKKIFKYFKKIPKNFTEIFDSLIEKTEKINYKELKRWYRDITKYPETIYDKKFLESMGWENDEIERFIVEKQKVNSNKLSEKKLKNPELYYDRSPKRIEYWLKKGFSEDESIKMISESQKTFSKSICIKKYGEEKGLEIFNLRQLKWVESLNKKTNIKEINSKKNSYNYDGNIDIIINRTSFLDETKQNILNCIKQKNIEDFIQCILTKLDVKSFSDIIPYLNSNIISNHYEIDKGQIKKNFFNLTFDKFSVGYYGQPVYNNGIRFKSVKEYKLSLLFEQNNCKFIYEKRYPNSNFICDFYIPNINAYVEYFGILDGKSLECLDEKQLKYYNKMIEKVLFCDDNKINLIYDTSFNKLCEKLKTII